ncbi:unnamed protein product [Adineta steineri]|uniref:Uncharacterized protein n=1 Tax=Adineta steineri TaxID=433720 RepID=A0A819N377_9BILA|nr:unnamed protein product [Adineta steineri]CAF0758064.1 unnamed protein product [Adineta steineri]CAF0832370.1 unnamed protein product [Adineta steineri]CAF3989323.1 unnamed protein product [Adineta steineri]CAF4032628.1 unnamed protein product [Adineta steineri]
MGLPYETQNGILTPPPRPVWLQNAINLYSRKFHFIIIPIGIIVAAVHLKFGVQYFSECPIQPMIPIYMIVHASVQLGINLLAIIALVNVRCNFPPGVEKYKKLAVIILVIILVSTFVLFLFSFAWLITGSVWVFGAKANGVQGDNPNATNTYCQSDLYKSAFVLLIINYVIHIVIISLIIFKRFCCNRKTPNPSDVSMNNRI